MNLFISNRKETPTYLSKDAVVRLVHCQSYQSCLNDFHLEIQPERHVELLQDEREAVWSGAVDGERTGCFVG